jgi:hypothetical protein
LKNIIQAFKEIGDPALIEKLLMTQDVSGTGTGVYVARGEYAGQGRSKHFAGLSISPRLPELKASRFLYGRKPEGFGTIPSEVKNTFATSHGHLVGYTVLEIPKAQVNLVKVDLELNQRIY